MHSFLSRHKQPPIAAAATGNEATAVQRLASFVDTSTAGHTYFLFRSFRDISLPVPFLVGGCRGGSF